MSRTRINAANTPSRDVLARDPAIIALRAMKDAMLATMARERANIVRAVNANNPQAHAKAIIAYDDAFKGAKDARRELRARGWYESEGTRNGGGREGIMSRAMAYAPSPVKAKAKVVVTPAPSPSTVVVSPAPTL